MTLVFDRISETYDNWYDSTEGRTIFELEVECLRSICANFRGNWLEVGVGTGRFAARLGVSLGLDLSLPMLAVAGTRGLKVCAGAAERLPFPESSMDGVLMALVLCFLKDPVLALKECARVLRPRGSLLLGFIPASSPWGRWYERKRQNCIRSTPLHSFILSARSWRWQNTQALSMRHRPALYLEIQRISRWLN